MTKNDSPDSKASLRSMTIQKTNLTNLVPQWERSSPYCKLSEPVLNEMWFLTIDPFVGIPVFIAKLSER